MLIWQRYREIFDRDIGSSFDIGEKKTEGQTDWSLSWPLRDTAKKIFENILHFEGDRDLIS